jgi:hypothetical protein
MDQYMGELGLLSKGSARNPEERSKRKEESKSQDQILEPQVLRVLL